MQSQKRTELEPLNSNFRLPIFGLNAEIISFLLFGSLVLICGMRAFAVVKLNIFIDCCSEFFFRAVFLSVQLFVFQACEEAFHYRVVVGNIIIRLTMQKKLNTIK